MPRALDFRIKLKLLKKNRHRCCYCGKRCYLWQHEDYAKTPDNAATIEHIYPKSDIRRLLASNAQKYLTIACHKCNSTKGTVDGYVFSKNSYQMYDNLLLDLLNGDYSKIEIRNL